MRWVIKLALIIAAMLLPASITATARAPKYQDYTAEVVKIIDGDTLRAKVAIWPKLTELATVRIRGIDTPELRARCPREKQLAILARNYVSGLIKPGDKIRLHHIKLGKYAGRVIATVFIKGTGGRWVNLGDVMAAANYARVYNGGKRKGWC